jgi:hypothetical protein
MEQVSKADFLYVLNRQRLEHPYIMQVAYPHHLGRIHHFPSTVAYAQWAMAQEEAGELGYYQIPGYRIALAFAGNLEGNRLTGVTENWEEELLDILQAMGRFYLEHTIGPKLGFYQKKYAL